MKSQADIAEARLVITTWISAKQKEKRFTGEVELIQRQIAGLQGMSTALQWVEENGGKTLQTMIDVMRAAPTKFPAP